MTYGDDVSDDDLAAFADALIAIAHRIEPRVLEVPGVGRRTMSEIAVLHEIVRRPGITATAAARALGLQRSNVSATIHHLVAEGLVARARAAPGERGVGFVLTAAADAELALIRSYRSERLRTAPRDILRSALASAGALEALADGMSDRSAAPMEP